MFEAAYSFTIPSTEDDTTLDCRFYHPEDLLHTLSADVHDLKGAVVAHPYAPLGGCYDDPVVLKITSTLVKQGHIVATFNFRGAGDSQGSTSWTGKGEKDDYISVVGVLLHYLRALTQQDSHESEVSSALTSLCPLSIVLAGYSYGALILSKLPPLETMTQRFETAAIGSSAAEIILRARRLATETLHTAQELETKHVPRGRPAALLAETSPNRSRAHSSTVTVGGEETDVSERRLNTREHHAADLVKKSVEMPRRIKMHLRRRSSSSSRSGDGSMKTNAELVQPAPPGDIKLRYLLISPVLAPLAHALVPPSQVSHLFGHHKDVRESNTGFGALGHPTLAIWGGQDGFTSAKKLRIWMDRLGTAAPGTIQGSCVETAGHFWREHGVMGELIQQITTWTNADTQ